MEVMKGTFRNGQIILDTPADWPDGCRVTVELDSPPEITGMTEEEQGDDPESIARWITEFDAIPPLQMSPDEEAAWLAARNTQKQFEKSRFEERAEKLRGIWE